jgi:type IV secretion system protein VirB5
LKLFRGERGEASISAPLDNPWLNSRRAWNSHVGSVVHSRRIWQVTALASLLVSLASVGGLISLASQSRFIPYVVEVDRLGQSMAVKMADRPGEADPRVIHASLAQFIRDARMVSFDRVAQNAAIWRVYAMLRTGDPALAKMTAFMRDDASNPFKRAESESVGVEIESVLQQTPETWQLIWNEKVWSKAGALLQAGKLRALVTVYTQKGNSWTTEEEIRANPLGVYIRDFNWSTIVEAK